MFPALIEKLTRREDLTSDEAAAAMAEVMEGRAADAQIAGLLVGLAMKGERPAEIVGLARTMRAHAVQSAAVIRRRLRHLRHRRRSVRARSTSRRAPRWSSRRCGVRVAKHGNRSVSSLSGSADVFEALGVTRRPRRRRSSSAAWPRRGIGFFFAPTFHPSMRHAGPTRRALGVRTAFNLLGPLTNPARRHAAAGRRAAAGVHRADGARADAARIGARLGGARRRRHRRDLDDRLHQGVGVPRRRGQDVLPASGRRRAAQGVAGGAAGRRRATRTRAIISAVLDGERGAARDVVLLNAGAALFIAGEAASVEDGMRARRRAAIDRGDARRTLDRLVALSTAEESAAGAGA